MSVIGVSPSGNRWRPVKRAVPPLFQWHHQASMGQLWTERVGAIGQQPDEEPIHRLFRILKRTGYRAYDDDVTTIASGVAFFVVLAVFPGIAAIVGLYS